MEATFPQAVQLLNLVNQQHASFEQLQKLFNSGILSDLLQADPETLRSIRPQIRTVLELDPQLEKFVLLVGGTRFDELVALGKYDFMNPQVTAERFDFHMTPIEERTIYTMHFKDRRATHEVIADMKAAHKKPCDFEEFLTLGARHPYLQNKRTIVFLEQGHMDGQVGEPLFYAALFGTETERRLGVGVAIDKWTPAFQFACVDA